MKLFIFGSNGMLGNYVKSYLSRYYEILPLTRNDYDLSKLNINSGRINRSFIITIYYIGSIQKG